MDLYGKKPEIDANHKLLLQIASNLNEVKFGVKIWNFEKIDPLGSKFDPKLTPGVKIFKILSTIPKFVSDDSEQLLKKNVSKKKFYEVNNCTDVANYFTPLIQEQDFSISLVSSPVS